jgi:hypothetical protein
MQSSQAYPRIKAGLGRAFAAVALLASQRSGGSVGPGRPTLFPEPLYRLIWRPALAEIVGDGRPRTVSMISLLSMPWR